MHKMKIYALEFRKPSNEKIYTFFYKKVHKTVPPLPYLLETKQFEGSIFSKETLTWHESRKLRSTSIKEKPDIWWVALQSNNINETWKGRLKSKTWQ